MKNHIAVDLDNQVMTCRVCRDEKAIPRPLLRDQHALLELVDEVAADHRECAAHPADPAKARRNRTWRKGLERVQRDQQRKNLIERLTRTPFPLRRAA